ncbi:MAG: hypothetical protein BEU04_02020 [Marine Group III euryarchaeote CG-Bathy1]|uniref:Methyltransferase-like protein 5 n=1 Tax=Marine Group III euryarchaeote CG-Bathy1 TaxID=1889001 RepID=A0A1J5TUF4_9ARCH|nr:MAG: hypothetical protein BEU04_02020 [Marine Group III euryarchaeote CG-Bathy1]
MGLSKLIQGVPDFVEAKPELEQYTTPVDIATFMLLNAFAEGDLKREVVDFGCGTGRLGIGAAFLGAEVIAIDIDIEAIEVGKKYSEEKEIAIKWMEMPIQNWSQKIDTIIMNPPFGAQRPGADREFIKKALEMAEKVWTIHLADSGKFIDKFVEDNGGKIISSWKMDMELKRTMRYHTKESKKVKAILYHLASLI